MAPLNDKIRLRHLSMHVLIDATAIVLHTQYVPLESAYQVLYFATVCSTWRLRLSTYANDVVVFCHWGGPRERVLR